MDLIGAVAIKQDDLFQGETLIRSVGTNVLLPRYPGVGTANAKPYVIGPSASEKVLGVLHLTNYRLIFKPAERPGPTFSIFLPAIAEAKNVSFFFVRKFRITMRDTTYIQFVMWRIPAFLAILNKTRAQASELNWDSIVADVAQNEHKVGDWQVAAV